MWFLKAKKQFFPPLEDMALDGKIYSMTMNKKLKLSDISRQQEANKVFELGSNMINVGLYEITLAAMSLVGWSGRWMEVMKLALRMVRGLGSSCQHGDKSMKESKAIDIFVCKCFLTRTKKFQKVHSIVKAILDHWKNIVIKRKSNVNYFQCNFLNGFNRRFNLKHPACLLIWKNLAALSQSLEFSDPSPWKPEVCYSGF